MPQYELDTKKAICQKKVNLEPFNGTPVAGWEDLGLETSRLARQPGLVAMAAATTFLCEVCPIKQECAEYAITMKATGVYGGRYYKDGWVNPTIQQAIDLKKEEFAA